MRLSAESALEAMRTQGSLPIYARSSTKIERSRLRRQRQNYLRKNLSSG